MHIITYLSRHTEKFCGNNGLHSHYQVKKKTLTTTVAFNPFIILVTLVFKSLGLRLV